jgi:hypothetical protein
MAVKQAPQLKNFRRNPKQYCRKTSTPNVYKVWGILNHQSNAAWLSVKLG